MKAYQKNYGSNTYSSSDPLRKFSHATRFNLALSLVDLPDRAHVLDFGGGDGAFLHLLKKARPAQGNFDAVLFEPYMSVEQSPSFSIATEWEDVILASEHRPFDLVICQEVMEHFAPHRQDEALHRIKQVMQPDATLLLSVPVELGLVALVKNLGRWKYRRNSTEIYNFRNLLMSVFAIPIPDTRAGDGYLSHMGFYFTDFHKILNRHFFIEYMVGSPFRGLPLILNSQVFFRARPRA